MTRILSIAAALLLVSVVLLFMIGVASAAPIALMTAVLCALPGFTLVLGAALGRASNEFALVRRSHPAAGHNNVVITNRSPARKQQEPLG